MVLALCSSRVSTLEVSNLMPCLHSVPMLSMVCLAAVNFMHALTLCCAGCWCDAFCSAAGDCCDDCAQACGAEVTCPRRRQPPATGLPRHRLRNWEPQLPASVAKRFTQTGELLETELACADATESLLPASVPNIEIPVVYVSARINGQGGVFNQTFVDAVIQGLSDQFARAGFTFKLVEHYTGDFNSAYDAAEPFIAACEAGKAGTCPRCEVYQQATASWQNPQTLFMYGSPAVGKPHLALMHVPPSS